MGGGAIDGSPQPALLMEYLANMGHSKCWEVEECHVEFGQFVVEYFNGFKLKGQGVLEDFISGIAALQSINIIMHDIWEDNLVVHEA